MYWLLLPLDANAARHISTDLGSSSGRWAGWFRLSWTTLARVVRGLHA
jgi:hypothetical protein